MSERHPAYGIRASVNPELTSFDFDNLDSAWNALASVSAANLSQHETKEAKAAVRQLCGPTATAHALSAT